jgi:Tfp pilus assembly protein PilF
MNARNQVSCEPAHPSAESSFAEKKLNYGVLSFEEGNYPAASTALQGVLDTVSSGKQEQVKAYKYLAFIRCVSGHEQICRDYFKKALEIDPNFNLDSAEAGHPTWGPVFRGIKSKLSK